MISASQLRLEVGSVTAGRRILGEIRKTHRTAPERRSAVERVYLDTFDWRVFRDGGSLFVERADGRRDLSWNDRDGGVRHRAAVRVVPNFAADLSPGPFRDALAPLTDPRRLLPLVRVTDHGSGLRILDSEDKTVARVLLVSGQASAPGRSRRSLDLPVAICLLPLKGYDAAYSDLARRLELQLGLARLEHGELDLALSAVGRSAGDYSSRPRLEFEPSMRADDAVRRICRALLEILRRNEPGTLQDLDIEFLHDFRVAVRRTRSALGQLKGVFPPRSLQRFRSEFSWVGSLTGPTRDLDVALVDLESYRAELPRQVRGDLDPLADLVRRRRDREHKRMVVGLRSKRYASLVAAWQEFVEREGEAGGAAPGAARPVIELARKRIRAAHGKVLEQGASIPAQGGADTLHRLRISCKKLRYLLEFFRNLFDADAMKTLIAELKRLQDVLGTYNDLELQRDMLAEFARELHGRASAPVESILVLGRLVDRLESRQVAQRARFAERFARFASDDNRRLVRRLFTKQDTRRT